MKYNVCISFFFVPICRVEMNWSTKFEVQGDSECPFMKVYITYIYIVMVIMMPWRFLLFKHWIETKPAFRMYIYLWCILKLSCMLHFTFRLSRDSDSCDSYRFIRGKQQTDSQLADKLLVEWIYCIYTLRYHYLKYVRHQNYYLKL